MPNRDNSIHQDSIAEFRKKIWDFYHAHGRSFAWRNSDNPYYVFISEVMLQQTQTHRVEYKFEEFIEAFPDFSMLASAPLREVLGVWQGLGYNRRGKFVHQAAQMIMREFEGALPEDPAQLVRLPGIGPATAASIAAFAYNSPTIFIETNIRSVFIHHFFNTAKKDISDKDVLALVECTVDHDNPREWYYALMDYGVYLKKRGPNPSRRSKHHVVQSKFEGSDRQIRGKIIKMLVERQQVQQERLILHIADEQERTARIIDDLVQEGLVCKRNNMIAIK